MSSDSSDSSIRMIKQSGKKTERKTVVAREEPTETETETGTETGTETESGSESGSSSSSLSGSDAISITSSYVLTNDPLYFVLSKLFVTESGKNIATILEEINNKLEKLATK